MAFSFAGGTDRIAYGTSFDTTVGAISFWLKTTQTTANAVPISIWTGSSRSGFAFLLNSTANKIRVVCYDGSTLRVDLTSTTSVNDGNWHHIGFNFRVTSGQNNALFIDGNSEANANSSANWAIDSTSASLYLGDTADAFWPSYVGETAEVAYFKGAVLTADEMASLARGASALHLGPPPTSAGFCFYAPLTRTHSNLMNSFGTVTGAVASPHPRILGGHT